MDVLVLPEMAFTGIIKCDDFIPCFSQLNFLYQGYVFKDPTEIEPYLEDSETGPSVQWAKQQGMF